jgi:hypothetical protein
MRITLQSLILNLEIIKGITLLSLILSPEKPTERGLKEEKKKCTIRITLQSLILNPEIIEGITLLSLILSPEKPTGRGLKEDKKEENSLLLYLRLYLRIVPLGCVSADSTTVLRNESGNRTGTGTDTGTGTGAFFEVCSGTGAGNLFSVKVDARVFNYSADFFVARFQRTKFAF